MVYWCQNELCRKSLKVQKLRNLGFSLQFHEKKKNYIFDFTNFYYRFPDDDKIALYFTSERKETTGIGQMTFGELKKQVGLYYNALKVSGIQKGDRVVGYMPNCPEAIIGTSFE